MADDIQSPDYWKDAREVNLSRDYWADAKTVKAEPNMVLHEKTGRVIAMPQTLNAKESEFLIKRDADEVKNFFAMEDIGPLEGLGKGTATFFLTMPQIAGELTKEQAELSTIDPKTRLERPGTGFGMSSNVWKLFQLQKDMLMRSLGNEKVIEKSEALINRNKEYVAKNGWERPEQGGLSGVMYDLGSGVSSLATALGVSVLMRSPTAAGVVFGAMQKSNIYGEAREKDMPVEDAAQLSSIAGAAESLLEFVGVDALLKVLRGNTAVSRFIKGAAIEVFQEGTQATAEEAITQLSGIREKDIRQTVEDILYQAALGGIIGGHGALFLGRKAEKDAVDAGLPPAVAKKLGDYVKDNVGAANENLEEFIDRELAPIAKDEESAARFMQIMQQFGNNEQIVNPDELSPDDRKVFNHYIELFNTAKFDERGVAAVESMFFKQLKEAGVADDIATAGAKVIGARADAASRALGITPEEWLRSKGLLVRTEKEKTELERVLAVLKGEARAAGKEKKRKQPTLSWLKRRGGVRLGGKFAEELHHIGITHKTNVGLFKKLDVMKVDKAKADFDNIEPETFEKETGVKPEVNEAGYVDRDWMIEQIRAETFAEEGMDADEAYMEDVIRELDERGIDVNDFTTEQIIAILSQPREEIPFYQTDPVDTKTAAFKNWFGDSKVVDENGDPLVVYHGTTKDIEEFKDVGVSNGRIYGDGFYFTPDKAAAQHYAINYEKGNDPSGGNIMPVYISLQNPFISKELESRNMLTQMRLGKLPSEGRERAMTEELKAQGYDGIIIYDTSGKLNQIVAFRPEQIKSVFNRGTFDPNDPRILFQDNARGSITFTEEGAIIDLFKTANPSTLFHELGHLFLRDMRDVAKHTKRPRARRDYEVIKEWLGAKGDNLTRAQEEKFARGFEQYLREGKAPKPALQEIFDRFKAWMESIYKSATDLNVEISDEVREVFDRMLGGDFVEATKLAQERFERDRARDYEIVAADEPQSTIVKDAGAVITDFGGIVGDVMTPISTRAGKISQELKHAIRKFVFNTGLHVREDQLVIKPFVAGVNKKFTPEDYRILDLALKNRDTEKIDFLMDKYGLTGEYAKVRELLDSFYIQAQDAGMDLGYIDDYFPRSVRRGMVGEYLAAIRNEKVWSDIKIAMAKADPDNQFTPEEKAEFVNSYLRGYRQSVITLAASGHTKERTVAYVTPAMNKYYEDSMQTLINYVQGIRHGIEERKFFGKAADDVEDSIGAFVLDLVENGKIEPQEEAEVRRLLKAIVEPRGPGKAMGWARDAAYIYTMGSPISAITQIQDLAFSMYKNGFFNTGVSVSKFLTGRTILTKEDLGIDRVMEEFADKTRSSNAVRNVFRATGLTFMDNMGKQTFIDAAYTRLVKMNKKNSPEFKDHMKTIFGERAEQVQWDLAHGNITDEVKYLLFSELSDFQPISIAEMPVGYALAGNWRVAYMLKTYTLKLFDIYRREAYDHIGSRDPKRVAKGFANLMRLSFALLLMGMGTDELKDFVLGRVTPISDRVLNNILRLFGISKYQIYKGKRDGYAVTAALTLLPPFFSITDDVIRDGVKISTGKIAAKDAQVWSHVPIGGKFYYWWWGGGADQNDGRPISPP